MRFAKSAAFAAGLWLSLLTPFHAKAQLSLFLAFSTNPLGISLNGSGTPLSTIALGTMQAYGGTVPSGITRTVNGTTNWTLTTPINVTVTGLNIFVPTFTMTASITPDAVNTWRVNGFNVSSGSTTTLSSTATYNTLTSYSISLTIPFSKTPGLISNTISFTAIGN
jgi:hypothetical protein